MKIAIITGGSRGLGQALVRRFSAENWQVVEFSRTGKHAGHHCVDLAQPVAARGVFEAVFAELAGQNPEEVVLVNNAGVLDPIRKLAGLTFEEVTASLQVNVVSQVALLQAFVKAFRQAPIKKTIVNISSGAASKGYSGWGLYCVGKAGLENLIRAIREEEKTESHPFGAANFDPYVMDTAMQAGIRGASESDFPQRPRFEQFWTEGKLLPPDLVAACLVTSLEAGAFSEVRVEAIVEIAKAREARSASTR